MVVRKSSNNQRRNTRKISRSKHKKKQKEPFDNTPSEVLKKFAIQVGYKSTASLTRLQEAVTHRTFVHETQFPLKDNQRLEFLGDAVLFEAFVA